MNRYPPHIKKLLLLNSIYYFVVFIIIIILTKMFWNRQAMASGRYSPNLLPLAGLLILPLVTLGLIFYNIIRMIFTPGARDRMPVLLMHAIILAFVIIVLIAFNH